MKRILLMLAAMIGLHAASPANAQAAGQGEPSAELARAAEQVLSLLRGEGDPAQLLTPEFVAQVPPAQFTAISQQLAQQYGAIQRVNRIEPQSAHAGTIFIDTERATLRLGLAIQPTAPHRIMGLRVLGAEMRGDSLEAVMQEFRTLPGQASLAIARLGDGGPAMQAAVEADRPLAIGSAFKLVILAELSRQIAAGERRWSDVVPIDRHSPSGPMQYWPEGAPVTLHTLATLMISQSDNSATDILLHVVGRENVERLMPTLGIAAPERNRPFLSTLEAFVLKTAPDALLRSWLQGDEAQRRAILSSQLGDLSIDRIDGSRIGSAPAHIDTIEWFASAQDLVRVMDWLRQHGDATAHAILAVSPGLSRELAGEYDYVGYKGGSEPGVINMTFLVRSRAGTWYAVAGTWNNTQAPVEDARFAALMGRALQLIR